MAAMCVFCSTVDNLTTSMNVKTARGESVVHICSEHEENASPKKVRELVESRESALAEMEAKCKELGFTMVPIAAPGQLSIVRAPEPAPEPMIPAAQVLSDLRPVESPKRTVAEAKAPASLKVREIDAPAVAVDSVSGKKIPLEKGQSYDTTKLIETKDGQKYRPPKTLEVEMQVVEGRAGSQIVVPKKIVSEAGETGIKVLPRTGASDKFKKDFENMAARSIADQGPDFTNKGSYEVREPRPCNFCDATGKAKIGGKECPRCKGAGEIA